MKAERAGLVSKEFEREALQELIYEQKSFEEIDKKFIKQGNGNKLEHFLRGYKN